jgi:DNA repair photolyase
LIPKLRREASKLSGETISIANSSDPYPDLDAETGLMRKCLEILSRHNCKVQIITKSSLVARDVDLLRRIPSTVSLTITTDDDQLAELIEPHAPKPSERLKTVETLATHGIPTSVRVDPIIPHVNDNPESLIEKLASIGVRHVTSSTYKVRPDNWRRFTAASPEKAEKLRGLYFERGEKIGRYILLPRDLRFTLMKTVGSLAQKYDLRFGPCREGLSQLNTGPCDGSWMLQR